MFDGAYELQKFSLKATLLYMAKAQPRATPPEMFIIEVIAGLVPASKLTVIYLGNDQIE